MDKRAMPPNFRSNNRGQLWDFLSSKWKHDTPELRVALEFADTLHCAYGYTLSQIGQCAAAEGQDSFTPTFTVRSASLNGSPGHPLIVARCEPRFAAFSTDTVTEWTAQLRRLPCRFFVLHSGRETRCWDVQRNQPDVLLQELASIPQAADAERELLHPRLKSNSLDEFADVLHACHNVIRNREHLDPAAAFDEIAKVLFVKVWVERELAAKKRQPGALTVAYLTERLGTHPLNDLFQGMKATFSHDKLFSADDRINLKPATGIEIVRLLEHYNLSNTSEDIKGIAFERFLGRTFRGEIGQFFTPRGIVEFMIRTIAPREGEKACDPACGSGGFLIRYFEVVKETIMRSLDSEYASKVSPATSPAVSSRHASLRRRAFAKLVEELDQRTPGSRLWKLANECVFGCDANDRMARTSKMNMIMHGDGHGGIHHHNGFLNVNGIFEERFDVVLTNPPFGASVETTDIISDHHVSHLAESRGFHSDSFGRDYETSMARLRQAVGQPIGSLFELAYRGTGDGRRLAKAKSEVLFIERCLNLLKPGGRLGIVLPEGIFNNSSLAYVREFCEDRARIVAVVSLPPETFCGAGATVKASLLFLRKFTVAEKAEFDLLRETVAGRARRLIEARFTKEKRMIAAQLVAARRLGDVNAEQELVKSLDALAASLNAAVQAEARTLLKKSFDYRIFLFDATRVGVTATGDHDANELYPNDDLPDGVTGADTCLELFRKFIIKEDPLWMGG